MTGMSEVCPVWKMFVRYARTVCLVFARTVLSICEHCPVRKTFVPIYYLALPLCVHKDTKIISLLMKHFQVPSFLIHVLHIALLVLLIQG